MYFISDRWEEVCKKVLAEHPELEANRCKIGYIESDKQKKNGNKIVYADCTKVTDKVRTLADYDFIITFYRDSETMNPKAKEVLAWHELKHAGCDEDGTTRVIPHDLEDFKEIIDKYGTDWAFI